MGRKIPGKKHHGVKDPEKQQKARLDKVKMKINARPAKEDHQDLPKSMRVMMAAREEVRNMASAKVAERVRKSKEERARLDSTRHLTYDGPLQKGMVKPLKPIPVFKQGEREHKRAFYFRMDKTIQSMKKRAEYEQKFKVEVSTDENGKAVVKDKEKDELELEEEKKKIEKLANKEKDELELEEEKKKIEKLAKKGIVRRTKEEKRVIRRQREKQRKNKKKKNTDEILDFSDLKDDVSFGDTVDAPPSLNFKGFSKDHSSRPAEGGKAKLLLSGIKEGQEEEGKRKKKVKLSMAQQVILERERASVVAQYRQRKAALLNS